MPAALIALALLAADPPKAKPPAGPAWTFQVRSLAAAAAALRPVAAALHGSPAALDDWLEETFGKQGLTGLDPDRPVVGTVRAGATAEDGSVLLLALPVLNVEAFLDSLDRADADPTPVKKHPGVTRFKWHHSECHLRFDNKHAFIVVNGDPADLDPKTLPDPTALFDKGDPAVATVTLHPAHLTDALTATLTEWVQGYGRWAAAGYVEWVPVELADSLVGVFVTGGGWQVKAFTEQAERVVARFTAEKDKLAVELTAVPKKGTALAKQAAAPAERKHRFAALRDTPDAAEVMLLHWPKFADGKDELDARKAVPPDWKESAGGFAPLLEVLSEHGLKAVDAGDFDFARVTVGPTKSGHFTRLYAATVPGTPADLLTAVVAFLKNPPGELDADAVAKAIKEPAAKAGEVAVYSLPAGAVLDPLGKARHGDDPPAAFAWGNGVMAFAVGPDAVAVVARAVAAKPAAAERVEVRTSPKRMDEFHAKLPSGCEPVGRAKYGDADGLSEMLAVNVSTEAGEVRVKLTVRHDWLRVQNADQTLHWMLENIGWPW